jgi:hypothetical protein
LLSGNLFYLKQSKDAESITLPFAFFGAAKVLRGILFSS